MMDFLRKHMRIIFSITIAGFLAGAFVGFGGYFFGKKSFGDAVAEVNGRNIPYRQYAALYNRAVDAMRKSKEDVSDEMLAKKKQEVVQDLIQEEVFWQESKKYGINVTDMEVAADIQHYPAFQKDGRFDQRAYFQVVFQVIRTTPAEFEESRRRQLAIFKLRQLIASSVKITEPELKAEYMRTHKGNLAGYEKDREKFLEGVRQEKVMLVFNEWFKQLNQELAGKIKVHLQEIERQS